MQSEPKTRLVLDRDNPWNWNLDFDPGPLAFTLPELGLGLGLRNWTCQYFLLFISGSEE